MKKGDQFRLVSLFTNTLRGDEFEKTGHSN